MLLCPAPAQSLTQEQPQMPSSRSGLIIKQKNLKDHNKCYKSRFLVFTLLIHPQQKRVFQCLQSRVHQAACYYWYSNVSIEVSMKRVFTRDHFALSVLTICSAQPSDVKIGLTYDYGVGTSASHRGFLFHKLILCVPDRLQR